MIHPLRPIPVVLAATVLLLVACEQSPQQEPGPVREVAEPDPVRDNPLENRYLTPFSAPPFHELQAAHFPPALGNAVDAAGERIEAIAANPDAPDFDNTIAALEDAGRDISRIAATFHGLLAVSDNAELEAMAGDINRQLSRHHHAVVHDEDLYRRIRTVAESGAADDLDAEQQRLLDETMRHFRQAGAGLDADESERLGEIEDEIARLTGEFAIGLRTETHEHTLLIEDEALVGELPESLVANAMRSARDRGHEQGWLFTLHAHSLYPFLRHVDERDLRAELYRAWAGRTDSRWGQRHDLEALMQRIVELRAERAVLLGFDSHLDYMLADSSIGNRQRLRTMLDEIAGPARRQAERELERLQDLARDDGLEETLQPWDWWYYARRLAERELDLDGNEVRQWFELDQVREGAFSLANRLWGLTFHLRSDIPAWHTDARAWEVRDAHGDELGVIYLDYPHRRGKSGGAWNSSYRVQHYRDGERVSPVVANVANFTPAAGATPALLSIDEVVTLFHEFGHALQGLLSDVQYRSLAGTGLPPDFVEFPATMLEHWALQPELLRMYAFNHASGAPIGDALIERLQRKRRHLQGLRTLQQLAAVELDLALHSVGPDEVPDVAEAEARVREELDLPGLLSPFHVGNGLESLFAERREAGDYRLLWSAVLAADAFAAFAGETTPLDREVADALRREILSRGNSRPPMESWHAFRGREPEVRYLLESRGLD